MKQFLIGLLVGLLIGLGLALLMPRDLTRRLPAMVGASGHLEGTVMSKRRLPDRLLLTLETLDGSTLATFTGRVDEIDLLVQIGDTVAVAARYEPFVEDPVIRRVAKPGAPEPPTAKPAKTAPPAGPDEPAEPAPPAKPDSEPAADEAPDADPDAADEPPTATTGAS